MRSKAGEMAGLIIIIIIIIIVYFQTQGP